MRKSELIALLTAIDGDPEVVMWNDEDSTYNFLNKGQTFVQELDVTTYGSIIDVHPANLEVKATETFLVLGLP